MTLESVLAKRRATYQKRLSKYVKYVMNDHFVIAMLFLIGAVAFQYSNFIKALPTDFIWGKLAASFLLAGVVFFGKIATMASAADQVFLVTEEEGWQQVIKDAKKRSMVLPGLLLLFLVAVAMPVVYVGQTFSGADIAVLFIIGLVLKWAHLGLEEAALRFGTRGKIKHLKWYLFGVGVMSFLGAFFVHPLVGLTVASIMGVVFENQLRSMRTQLIDWETLVTTEEERMVKINRFINLFIDTPTGKEKAKRRSYLDFCVPFLSGKDNPYQFLFVRSFLRGTSYFGLFGRLTAIGAVVLSLSEIVVFNLALGVLLLYVTGFQLLPLYKEVTENVMVRLYPQAEEAKFVGFSQLLQRTLFIQAIIFSLATLIGTDPVSGLMATVISSVFVIFFVKGYARKRLAKHRPN